MRFIFLRYPKVIAAAIENNDEAIENTLKNCLLFPILRTLVRTSPTLVPGDRCIPLHIV